jgi:hypothetical protein
VRIVRTLRYRRDLKKLKASADDVAAMEQALTNNPLSGALIQGLRDVRKARFRIANRGKSSGGRAIYYFVLSDQTVIMLTAYAKAEKDELTPEDRKVILRVLEEVKQ